MNDNVLVIKSKAFAIRIIRLYQFLTDKKEFVMAKQLLRSGTSIGANVHEAEVAMSKSEFVSKLNISLKEANETDYWIELLHETEYISNSQYESIHTDCVELIKLLISIIKSTKSNNQ